jgi:hypothetical protein
MTDLQAQQQHPHYLMALLSTASDLYQQTKSLSPFLEHCIDQMEGIIHPMTSRIYSYGEPFVYKFDDGVDVLLYKSKKMLHTVTEHRQISIREKKRFYVAAVQAWMTKNLNYEEFWDQILRLYGRDIPTTLKPYAAHFFDVTKEFKSSFQTVPELIAYVLADGTDRVFNAFIHAWGDLKMITFRHFIESLRKELDSEWNENIKEKAQIFYSVASLEKEIKDGVGQARVQARSLVTKAHDVAERTTYFILAAADDLSDWALDSFDRRFISKVFPAPIYELELKGQDRFWAIQNRIRVELRLAFSSKLEEIQTSSFFITITDTIQLEHRVDSFKSLVRTVKTLKWEDLKDKEWPQQIIETLDNGLMFLGLERVVIFMKNSFWKRLDHNSDGKLSMEDLYKSAAKAGKFNPWKALYNMLKSYEQEVRKALSQNMVAVNGDSNSH